MLGYKFTKFDTNDYIFLGVIFICIWIPEIYYFISKNNEKYTVAKDLTCIGLYMFIVISPLGFRFRNFYVTLILMIFSLKLIYVSNNNILSYMFIIGIIYYSIFRVLFRLTNNGKEFIPLGVSKTGIHVRFSKLENRMADDWDQLGTILLYVFGLIIYLIVILNFRNN